MFRRKGLHKIGPLLYPTFVSAVEQCILTVTKRSCLRSSGYNKDAFRDHSFLAICGVEVFETPIWHRIRGNLNALARPPFLSE